MSFVELEPHTPIVSPLRNVPFSNIKCISWHPHCLKIAVACSDDTVRIYYDNGSVGPILKYKQQRNISCIEWRPLSFSEIAVGCDAGVYVWNVDPFVAITRPTISNATLLHHENHVPIVSLAWSPRGDLLATCSNLDSTVLVWNVEMNENSSLKRPGSTGNHIMKWCKSGAKLLITACGPKFRVWDCLLWESELWEINSGEIAAACWSPCGSVLLFATSEEPFIYYLSSTRASAFNTKSTGPNEAIPIVDCSKIERNGTIVGGLVKDMEWDPEGRHVAVLFQNTNYVAIFRTKVHPVLQIFASVFIAGAPEESPCLIQFQKNFKHGACLTVAWSSGRLQHFPIVYSVEFETTPNYSLSTSLF
ncbi:aladin-like isoform X2 [Agrilus planipennis]|nr:aladin-like isoform X2 [Agrilus planipennis]